MQSEAADELGITIVRIDIFNVRPVHGTIGRVMTIRTVKIDSLSLVALILFVGYAVLPFLS